MTNEKLQEILIKHRKWLNSEEGGERAACVELTCVELTCMIGNARLPALKKVHLLDSKKQE